MSFAPSTFHFLEPAFDERAARLSLPYRFDDGPVLVERLGFPGARVPLEAARRAALDRAVDQLHLAAGVSYYKAGLAPAITHWQGGVPAEAAAFFDTFYRRGLGEFAYRNGLTLDEPIPFPVDPQARWAARALPAFDRTVVPLGGGKDSLVALEAVRAGGHGPAATIAVGDSPLIERVAATTGVSHIRIERTLAPELMALNRQGAYNGHVPITGILAFVLVCASILYEFDTVVMANERSASTGNLRLPDGTEVNHQYSKSLDFERRFRAYNRAHGLSSFEYFSVLRPYSELAIAERFSRYPRYFDAFSSCNGNFRQSPATAPARWCGDCPKCRFVFLMLAPFVARERLAAIFGADLLDDPAQAAGFDALIGRGAHKPFECVGEADESLAAFVMLCEARDWRGARLVERFREAVLPDLADPRALVERARRPSGEHEIPDGFEAGPREAQRV